MTSALWTCPPAPVLPLALVAADRVFLKHTLIPLITPSILAVPDFLPGQLQTARLLPKPSTTCPLLRALAPNARQLYPHFQLSVSSFLHPLLRQAHLIKCTHTITHTVTPAQLTPGDGRHCVLHPISLSKSCSFFKAHFSRPVIRIDCACTAHLPFGIMCSLPVSHALTVSSQQAVHALRAGTILIIFASSL